MILLKPIHFIVLKSIATVFILMMKYFELYCIPVEFCPQNYPAPHGLTMITTHLLLTIPLHQVTE